MKWKLIFGVIAVFALIGILGSAGTNHQQVAGVHTMATPAAPTIVHPTKTPTPTKKPTPTPTVMWYPPTATPMPVTSVSTTTQTTQTTQTCAGATALCADGTCSYAVHHQGACSHHGGVAQWYQ